MNPCITCRTMKKKCSGDAPCTHCASRESTSHMWGGRCGMSTTRAARFRPQRQGGVPFFRFLLLSRKSPSPKTLRGCVFRPVQAQLVCNLVHDFQTRQLDIVRYNAFESAMHVILNHAHEYSFETVQRTTGVLNDLVLFQPQQETQDTETATKLLVLTIYSGERKNSKKYQHL
ncbi:hypothetical protein BC830DRAFT_736213 [Chytriomyces sp. MP71]|nr:hypothetical protein BC830DRAFT_736213 [Chytriomyces sp. MP71]